MFPARMVISPLLKYGIKYVKYNKNKDTVIFMQKFLIQRL